MSTATAYEPRRLLSTAPLIAALATACLTVFVGNPKALAALAATPAAVVAVIAGNGHFNRIREHPAGFWQIATSSLADFPMQVRALRLRRGPGGRGFVLETWMADHDGAGLAGPARELAFLDAQGGRPQGFAGAREDRNARLFVTR